MKCRLAVKGIQKADRSGVCAVFMDATITNDPAARIPGGGRLCRRACGADRRPDTVLSIVIPGGDSACAQPLQ